MTTDRPNKTSSWLKCFFEQSHRSEIVTGAPLFSYLVSELEFNELSHVLKVNAALLDIKRPALDWAACYCLFVAEFYRRKYDNKWEWAGPDGLLAVDLDSIAHRDLTVKGLKYWKRTLRSNGKGRDFLGTLFSEGGLPWSQISSGEHGFNRAIKAGLKHWHAGECVGAGLVNTMARFDRSIPIAFQNPGTHELMAGIVTTLMTLAEAIPELSQVSDPVSLLDTEAPGWRQQFPIPLGEENGRKLVKGWLEAAVLEQQCRRARNAEVTVPLCRTVLCGELPDWTLETLVTLPKEIGFDLGDEALSNTRTTLCIYEGDRMALQVGVVYGEHDREKNRLLVKSNVRNVAFERQQIEQPLELRAYSEGVHVGSHLLEQSDILLDELPLIFDKQDEGWVLCGATSVSLRNHTALVRIPADTHLLGTPQVESSHTDSLEGRWILILEDAQIQTVSGMVSITLGNEGALWQPTLVGAPAKFDTLPGLTWLGAPTVVSKLTNSGPAAALKYKLNGDQIALDELQGFIGVGMFVGVHPTRGLLLRRKIGVLPSDFRLVVHCATYARNPQIVINTQSDIHVSAHVQGADTQVSRVLNAYKIQFSKRDPDSLGNIQLRIARNANDSPVEIRIPFPAEPARLVDLNGNQVFSTDFVVDELNHLRVVLTPEHQGKTVFHIELKLLGHLQRPLVASIDVIVKDKPTVLSLHDVGKMVERMLGANSDLDNQVQVRVMTNAQHCEFRVRRFSARFKRTETGGNIELLNMGGEHVCGQGFVEALRLSAPEETTVTLQERKSDGVGTGVYELPEKLRTTGPWLVHPTKNARVNFRPHLVGLADPSDVVRESRSLHQAAKNFDFNLNSTAFENAMTAMAIDFNHRSWAYLKTLLTNYSHIPLSSFQAWKAVAKSPAALSMAYMKLELDGELIRRFESELAVFWEAIPVHEWERAFECYRNDIDNRLKIPSQTPRFVLAKLDVLKNSVPTLAEIITRRLQGLEMPSVGSAQMTEGIHLWYLELLREHSGNRWPKNLQEPLESWYQSQEYLPVFKAFSGEHPHHARTVVQLPYFMASLTHGCAHISDLDENTDAARFDIRQLASFDAQWYSSVFACALAYLRNNSKT